jgi:MFS family permease
MGIENGSRGGFLSRERSVAAAGYDRWLVPPAALAVHLSIGEVYAFSVFNLPLTRLVGGDHSAPADWALTDIGWVFSLAIVFLGLSAAAFGPWLERVGPRTAMFAAAACFGGGFLVAAVGVHLHQLWLLFLGYGVLGGIGLGIGYISPVSTLIKWFPDRPGMATGLAIMGFGGGAMIGSPLSEWLMASFRTPDSPGVAETFVVLGLGYFAFMAFGALTVRLPPPGWNPGGAVGSAPPAVTGFTPAEAIRTPQFWLLWAVLFLLTAWSAACVAGPVLVNYIRAYQIDRGVPKVEAYTVTMYLMAGLLAVGFACNLLVRPTRRVKP